mgnify:FL=1
MPTPITTAPLPAPPSPLSHTLPRPTPPPPPTVIRAAPPTARTHRRPPPIFLNRGEDYDKVRQLFKLADIVHDDVLLTDSKVRFNIKSESDFRYANKLLRNGNIQFYSFPLPDDKNKKVVIRGLLTNITEAAITADLADQGFDIVRVSRMKGGADRHPIPLVLVEYKKPTDDTLDIFQVKSCVGFRVRVEAPRKRTNAAQCYRCQQFRHTSSMCFLPPRCLKCAGKHLTPDCTKSDRVPAKCVNCNGPHPANFSGCPSFPARKTAPPPATRNVAPPPPTALPRSYASAVSGHQHPTTSAAPTAEAALAKLMAFTPLLDLLQHFMTAAQSSMASRT